MSTKRQRAAQQHQKTIAFLRTKLPKKPDEEIGKEIELLGKDWAMGGQFVSRSFKCYVTRYDPHKKWQKKDIPQVSTKRQPSICHSLLCRVHFLSNATQIA